MSGHLASARLYLTVFLVLMAGTLVTVFASNVDLGRPGNVALALLIAAAKVCCVGAFFMHLRWDRGWLWFFVLYPLVLFCILLFALWPDIAFRMGDAARHLGPAR